MIKRVGDSPAEDMIYRDAKGIAVYANSKGTNYHVSSIHGFETDVLFQIDEGRIVDGLSIETLLAILIHKTKLLIKIDPCANHKRLLKKLEDSITELQAKQYINQYMNIKRC